MKINALKIKGLRQARFWSQEELAIASGLGLRTIQRVESAGKCSVETFKALAATFEIDAKELCSTEAVESTYYNVQLGYTLLAGMFAAFAMCLWQFTSGNIAPDAFVLCAVSLSIVCALFGSLTVTIQSNVLTWYFSIGFWKKVVDINAITKVQAVKNKGWWGWGIRYYGQGWLYSVSGLGAVELTLNNGSKLRIGSDEPNALTESLNGSIVH